MWFEILPAAGIIFTVFNIPWIFMYGVHTLAFGNVGKEILNSSVLKICSFLQAYRRHLHWDFDKALYLRDRRLTDNPYIRNVRILIII